MNTAIDEKIRATQFSKLPTDWSTRRDINDVITGIILPDGEDLPRIVENAK